MWVWGDAGAEVRAVGLGGGNAETEGTARDVGRGGYRELWGRWGRTGSRGAGGGIGGA